MKLTTFLVLFLENILGQPQFPISKLCYIHMFLFQFKIHIYFFLGALRTAAINVIFKNIVSEHPSFNQNYHTWLEASEGLLVTRVPNLFLLYLAKTTVVQWSGHRIPDLWINMVYFTIKAFRSSKFLFFLVD